MISRHHEWRPWQPIAGQAARRDIFKCLDCGIFLPAELMGKDIEKPGCLPKSESDNSGFRPFAGKTTLSYFQPPNDGKKP